MAETLYSIDDLLEQMVARNASDLHVTVGAHPVVRVRGKLEPLHPVLESAAQRALAPDPEHVAKTPGLGERAARKAHERTRR